MRIMAKRRKKAVRRRRSSPKRRTVRKRTVKRVGVTAGMLASGAELVTARPDTVGSPLSQVTSSSEPIADRVGYIATGLKENAVKPKTWMGVVGGAVVSASPKIPLVKIIARPIDNAIKAFTRGRWGL